MADRPLAVVTGGSSGIGRGLVRQAVRAGYDVLSVSDLGPDVPLSAAEGQKVRVLQADLSRPQGRDRVSEVLDGRVPDVLLANAGQGLGGAFLDQDADRIRTLLDTNVVGTTLLVHRIAQGMARRGSGRILLTGSIAGRVPGPFHAVYNASKAYLNLLAPALRNELGDRGITVTCLMPGATDTPLFERAGLSDTWLGRSPKSDPDAVARAAWRAMMAGRATVVPGLHNRAILLACAVVPAMILAHAHRAAARPRT